MSTSYISRTMTTNWKRPESVPFPSVWHRFEGRKEINGRIPKFWVQDIPEELFEEAVEIMCSNFIYDEPLCRYSGIANDELSLEEIKQTWKHLVQDKMALICFMENPDPNGKPIIAGLNMTYVSEKDVPIPEFKAKKWLKVLDTVMYLCKLKDAYAQLGINHYLGALGLSVLSDFRGQGIGLELLNARSEMCRATGLRATLSVFTSIVSQKLADKSGFKDIIAMSYDEIQQKEPRFTYPGINEHTKIMRYMYKMID